MKNVFIIDYGMGNLDSVKRAVDECGYNAYITDFPSDLKNATSIILPGVGAFTDGMNHLTDCGFVDELNEQVRLKQIPLLGICLGMQLLAEVGFEFSETKGLGFISGEVIKFLPKNKERIPHVGWNDIEIKKDHAIVKDIPTGTDFYFVHSYYFNYAEKENLIATTNYCSEFASIIGKENIVGTQFHPEKSQKAGFRILKNFLEM